jgi:hypothetical protein
VIQRAVAKAARRAGVAKRVSCHTDRHSFATHLLDWNRLRQKAECLPVLGAIPAAWQERVQWAGARTILKRLIPRRWS